MRISHFVNLFLGIGLMTNSSFAFDAANDGLPAPSDGVVTFNGTSQRTYGIVKTYNIPLTNYPSTLEVNLRGGDGGYAQSGRPANPTNKASKGGGGILGIAQFSIHPSDAGALRPGGEIRLIVGNKGYNRQSGIYAHAASGGGGGSGLLYRGPLDSDDWQPLIIAGGGGGAYASTVTGKVASNRNGGNGQSTEAGQNGFGNGGNRGIGGDGGDQSNANLGGGGGGWTGSGDNGGGRGYPAGGAGGVLSVNTQKGAHGGFGCGGGGDGGKVTLVGTPYMSGGGGGGYSGGGSGAHAYGGGGGGSFLIQASSGIEPVANSASWTPRGAGLNQNGFVSIETSGAIASGDINPIVNIDGDNPQTVVHNSTYADAGATGEDYYGNSLTVITDNTVDPTTTGSYAVNYTVTDQFGQTTTETRDVNVVPSLPRFYLGATPTLLLTTVDYWEDRTDAIATIYSTGNTNLTYSIEGSDASHFNLNAATGVLHFSSQPDYETPSDVGSDNTYTLTVKASDGTRISTSTLTVNVLNVAELPTPPVLSNHSIVENQIDIGTVSSTDGDRTPVTYAISTNSGADSALFQINSNTGFLRFITAPNYEDESDQNNDNIYELVVIATSGGHSVSNTLNVTVTNGPDPLSAPVLDNTIIEENQTVVGTASSSDEDGTEITYSLDVTSHPDLEIHPTSGALSFSVAPDFENPTDTGDDNTYYVKIIATSGGESVTSTFTIIVNDVNELPTVPQLDTLLIEENKTLVDNVYSSDDDGTQVDYSILPSIGADSALFQIDESSGELSFIAAPNFEVPTDQGQNNIYEVTVFASSGSDAVSQTFNITVADADERPTTPQFDNVALVLPENQTFIGTASGSTDEDGTPVTYVLTTNWPDYQYAQIDPNTGVLSFITAPDFESPDDTLIAHTYFFSVAAKSNGQISQSILVNVRITDVNEPHTTPELDSHTITENQTEVGIVSATDPDGTIVTYAVSTTEGADSDKFQIDSSTGVLSFIVAPNYEVPLDQGLDNTYQVVVIATSGGYSSSTFFDVSVENVAELKKLPSLTNQTVTENFTLVGQVRSNAGATFALSPDSGADRAFFTITNSGELSFINPPDFGDPLDQG